MKKPATPIDEAARISSLRTLPILDTYPEDRFDRVTRLAKRIFDVDICLISLVDSHRQWFKSRQGLDACETRREISFCGHAILDDAVFFVENAAEDERFHDNPLVTGEPDIRFYAGRPIKSPEGHRIGTLCLIDRKPRTLTDTEFKMLDDLARMVEEEFVLLAQSSVDELTQLINRRGLYAVTSHVLPLCERLGTIAELIYFDLNDFKRINDSHGHRAGDAALIEFSRLLTRCFRSADVIARIGGDEFVVLMTATTNQAGAALQRLAQMRDELAPEMRERIHWSAGIAAFDAERHTSVDALISDADAAMYSHKIASKPLGDAAG
ncbi:MAG: sensor domain-containing diguanylate cyclase [Pseudomonadota bacterium]